MKLDARIPTGDLADKWDNHRFESRLVSPANRRKFKIIVVGTGLAGASASAALGELGYNVTTFCLQDSPRRAHSIAAQGGINAAKNYQNDGDSIRRLFYDTIKGGDFRSREANVYRLAQVSNAIIDHCTATGVPFAREYGGLLANRSFGGTQVSRTFYARGQTGQQLLLGAYSSMMRQVAAGRVTILPRREIMDIVVTSGSARGVITRNLITGELESHGAHAVVLATGGFGNVFYLSTNAMNSNVSAAWKAYRRGACFANPSFVQIHPTCIPVHGDHQSKLTLMSESLRNDGRVWVPKTAGDTRTPHEIPDSERLYYLEERYPAFGNLVPRDVASRNAKEQCDEGRGVGPTGRAVYLDFADAVNREGEAEILRRYGNLFHMYEKITARDPVREPMMIYPAVHYTMGGLWVDYNLMTTLDGLFALGEANFSDHGANRLGASALMQGLADGYFVLPVTLGNYLAGIDHASKPDISSQPFVDAIKEAEDTTNRLLAIGTKSKNKKTVNSFHRELGMLLWDNCGMARNKDDLSKALDSIDSIKERFWNEAIVPGNSMSFNQSLERAGRIADYLDFAGLLTEDALAREESCGCHFREESQTPDHEALRDDDNFSHVAAWAFTGDGQKPAMHKEQLIFENVTPTQRSYK